MIKIRIFQMHQCQRSIEIINNNNITINHNFEFALRLHSMKTYRDLYTVSIIRFVLTQFTISISLTIENKKISIYIASTT